MRRPRGFGFVVVILMLGVVSMVAASISLRTQRNLQLTAGQTRQQAGDDVAYSGLQVGLAHAASAGAEDWSGLEGLVTMPQRTQLGYRLLVNSNFNNEDALIDPDGTEIPGEAIYLKSLAYTDGTLDAGMSAVVAQQRGMAFNYPAFGSDNVTVEDSSIQSVAGGGSAKASEWTTVEGEGHIRTNGTSEGSVSLTDGTFVDGDVIVGPGGDPVSALQAETGSGFSGTADIAGATLPLPEVPAGYSPTAPDSVPGFPIPIPIPPMQFLNAISIQPMTPGTYDQVVWESGEGVEPNFTGTDPFLNYVALEPGDYYINDLSTGPNSVNVILATGEVRLHVKNGVNLKTLYINSDSASDLQIYQTDPGGSTQLTQVLGSMVLAGQGPVEMNQSELNGALYGRSVAIRGSKLGYPKSLDGLALNDKIKGDWSLFGARRLNSSEIETLRGQLADP